MPLSKAPTGAPPYLRCTRASWDDHLARYPCLPVTHCAGFEPPADAAAQAPGK
jgi:hypothetical protein